MENKKRPPILRIILTAVCAAVIAASVGVNMLFRNTAVPVDFAGNTFFLFKSDKMEPDIPENAMVIADRNDVGSNEDPLKRGTIILCEYAVDGARTVTVSQIHNVIKEEASGAVSYEIKQKKSELPAKTDTDKGDSKDEDKDENEDLTEEKIRIFQSDVLAKCVQQSEGLGAAVLFIKGIAGISLTLFLPCLLIILTFLLPVLIRSGKSRGYELDRSRDNDEEEDDFSAEHKKHKKEKRKKSKTLAMLESLDEEEAEAEEPVKTPPQKPKHRISSGTFGGASTPVTAGTPEKPPVPVQPEPADDRPVKIRQRDTDNPIYRETTENTAKIMGASAGISDNVDSVINSIRANPSPPQTRTAQRFAEPPPKPAAPRPQPSASVQREQYAEQPGKPQSPVQRPPGAPVQRPARPKPPADGARPAARKPVPKRPPAPAAKSAATFDDLLKTLDDEKKKLN